MMRRLALFLIAFLAAPAVHAQEADIAAAFELLVAKNYDKARVIAAPLAEAGDADAQHLLGFLYENGLGVPRDLQHAVDLYVKAARAGQPDAQFALGELALSGDGVKQSAETAAGWYRLAARQGHSRARLRLGVMHTQGNGVESDMVRAVEYFGEAADAGEPEAQRNLAIAYLSGHGLPLSYAKAAAWFEKAAETGDPVSHYNLGLLKQSGALGAPDEDAAAAHMRVAAAAGFGPAMTALGLLIHDGVPAEEHPADWFERAAQAGDPQGRFLYAVALSEGDGRAADPAAALAQLDALLADTSVVDPALLQQAEKLRASLVRRQKGAGLSSTLKSGD